MDGHRVREAIRELLAWIDAGTRTVDLASGAVADVDLIELVKPDGTRYTVTALELKTYTNAP